MTCAQCGSEIEAGNQFCQECGAAAPAAPSAPAPPPSKPRSAALTYLGLAALLVVGAGVTFWALSAGGDGRARSSRTPPPAEASPQKPSDEPVVTATVRDEADPVDVNRRDSPPRRSPAPRPAAEPKPKTSPKREKPAEVVQSPSPSPSRQAAAESKPAPEPKPEPKPIEAPPAPPVPGTPAPPEEPVESAVFAPPAPSRPPGAAPPAPSGPPPPPPIQTRAPVRRSSSKPDDEPEPGGRVLRPSATEVKEAEQAAAKIPASGNLYWTGNVDKNQPVVIENGEAVLGLLDGDPLPGKPVEVQMPSAVCAIRESPSAANGWNRLVFVCSKKIQGQSVNIQWYAR